MSLVKNLQQLREELNKMQDKDLSETVLTPVYKQYERLRVVASLKAILWSRGRLCSEETLCVEEARLR